MATKLEEHFIRDGIGEQVTSLFRADTLAQFLIRIAALADRKVKNIISKEHTFCVEKKYTIWLSIPNKLSFAKQVQYIFNKFVNKVHEKF